MTGRKRRAAGRLNHRGRMPSQAVVTDDEYAALFEGADTGPLFPVGVGAILHDLAHPTPPAGQSGPPWTHTFTAKPPCDFEDCCKTDEACGCNCHKVQPTHTLTPLPEAP